METQAAAHSAAIAVELGESDSREAAR